jgi:hypothetical protein
VRTLAQRGQREHREHRVEIGLEASDQDRVAWPSGPCPASTAAPRPAASEPGDRAQAAQARLPLNEWRASRRSTSEPSKPSATRADSDAARQVRREHDPAMGDPEERTDTQSPQEMLRD